ncbi:DUF1800 domain-containing protein [Nocardioides sp.]|uniref:DUF1800 domain-containing protein n=1 Tax=Nocardioides sp. TaxID=35761 RepID=UPI001A2A0B4C|nr:DUF1800 domain-containing protein [Nocardioides sp.]MBJ7358865.1 DUF1800 domain-containing protein [Nocardioides sp.]
MPEPVSLASSPTRRGLHRAVAGGLATAAVTPLLVAGDAAASPAAAPGAPEKGKGKWHRCKVHRKHTCRKARTCRHRKHKPQPPTDDQTDDQPDQPTPTLPPLTELPDPAALHLASRFTYGMTPALHAEMQAAGGAAAWFAAQLLPNTIADPVADGLQSWWASVDLDTATIVQRDKSGVEAGWEAMANYQRWCLLRRIYSKRQVLEVVTEFFESHLHVPVQDDGVYPFRAAYGKLIRSHALGRFDQMLVAAITHPAMGASLDNASSTKNAPNENLGRELLELHTVGRGHHTEDDVKSSARILTGYRVDMWRTWNVWYEPNSHWTGAVKVLDFTHPNAAADGRPVAEAYLTYLAHHPATATRLAKKLAQRFVSDSPSDALVAHLADVYLANQTAIVPVLRALVAHPEFAASAGGKVRTPTDDVVATYRALDVTVHRPVNDGSTANSILWQTSSIGQMPFGWARPDGPPENGAAWSSASRVLASFDSHYSMCGGWWPKQDASYHPVSHWVPLTGTQSMRFDALVDHLSRRLLCRQAGQRVVEACCLATGLAPGTAITPTHALVRWGMPVLLTTLLDSPEHLSR